MDIDKIFDSFLKVSDFSNRLDAIKKDSEVALQTDQRVCGHCDKWMKSSLCPFEKNINGRNRGPSMGSMACSEFILTPWVKALKVERTQKLEADIAQFNRDFPSQSAF